MQEGVALVGLGFGFEFGGWECEGLVDVFLYEGVEDFQALVEPFLRDESLSRAGAGDEGLDVLDFGEGVGELYSGIFEGVDTVAEKEVRCGIEGESEEEIVDTNCRAGKRSFEQRQESLEVSFESVEIRDSVLDELRSDELARVVPHVSICGEDAWVNC